MTKPRLLGLMLLVFIQQTRLAHPRFIKEELESIVVKRRQYYPYDYFTINTKVNHTCSTSSCSAHKAEIDTASGNHLTSCSCICWDPRYFFRSSELKCTKVNEAKIFGGCKKYFNGLQPNYPVDLSTSNSKTFTGSITVDNCSLSGQYYYDYSGFQSRWKTTNDFFTRQLHVYATGGQTILQIEWPNPDTHNTLSGRMIRLNVSCTVSSPALSVTRCILFKAVGTVTYYGPLSSTTSTKYQAVSTVGSERHLSLSTSSTPLPSLSLSPTSLEELSTSKTSLPRLSSSSVQYLPPPPLSVLATSPLTLLPSVGLFSHTSRSLRMTQSISSLVPPPQIKTTNLPKVTFGQMETTLSLKDLPIKSEDSADKEVSTVNLSHSTSREHVVPPIRPSKPTTPKSSGSTGGVVPADKGGRTGGSDDGVVIGGAVGGALAPGIIVIIAMIVFWKRRKALNTKGKQAKQGQTHNHVTNPAYETSANDIQLKVPKGMNTMSSPAQEDQYQGLIIGKGRSDGAAIYSSADSNYDNCAVYQSLDKPTPSSPVYQALYHVDKVVPNLLEGAPTTGIPNSKHTTLTNPKLKPSAAGIPASEGNGAIGVPKSKSTAAGQPKRGSSAAQDPVYNVLDGPGAGQGTMTEPLYNVLEGQDYAALTVDPLYNVLEGPESDKGTPGGGPSTTEEAPYNVLEGPDAINSPTNEQGPSENDAIYNVLESPDGENSPLVSNESSNEPLYNVLEEQDGHGSKQGLPKESLHTGAHDNPSYEQTLEFNEPYADVHRPETQRESVYEPLRQPREDLYEPLA